MLTETALIQSVFPSAFEKTRARRAGDGKTDWTTPLAGCFDYGDWSGADGARSGQRRASPDVRWSH